MLLPEMVILTPTSVQPGKLVGKLFTWVCVLSVIGAPGQVWASRRRVAQMMDKKKKA